MTMEVFADRFDCLLLDLDGVVYRGPHEVPGSVSVLNKRGATGQPCVYVTNNAARTPVEVAHHLSSFGLIVTPNDVVTSPQAAVALLPRFVSAGSAVLVVGGEGIEQALRDEGYRPVRTLAEGPSIVMQGFSPQVTWADLAEAAYAIESGLAWIATNLDLTFPTDRGLAPGNGSLVAAVANAVGKQPDAVAGKPESALIEEALRRCGQPSGLMIGDRLDTDVRGGNALGIPTLFVLTGVHGIPELLDATGLDRPDFVSQDLLVLDEQYPEISMSSDRECVQATCGGITCRIAAGRAADSAWDVEFNGQGTWIDAVRSLYAASGGLPPGHQVKLPQAVMALEAFTGTVSSLTQDL